MTAAAKEFACEVAMSPLCRALDVSRSSVYRLLKKAGQSPVVSSRPRPDRALTEDEKRTVLGVLHEKRFVDLPPAQVWAALLDEGKYLCSIRTMYRILDEQGEVRERRNQLRHPAYQKPELLATCPNEVWSWDIERHEVLPSRAVMEGHRLKPVAAGL